MPIADDVRSVFDQLKDHFVPMVVAAIITAGFVVGTYESIRLPALREQLALAQERAKNCNQDKNALPAPKSVVEHCKPNSVALDSPLRRDLPQNICLSGNPTSETTRGKLPDGTTQWRWYVLDKPSGDRIASCTCYE
jgi:hypothetical protein